MNLVKNKEGKVFVVVVIVIAVIIALAIIAVGGVFGYFWNATPSKLGIEDTELFNGETLESLGLADVKIKDIYKQFKAIKNADTSTIVENAPTDADKTEAEVNTSKVANDDFITEDGKNDYSIVLEEELKYDKNYIVSYDDTTLCYIFNEILHGATSGNDDSIDFLNTINASINEVTIKVSETKDLRLVMSIDVEPFRDKLKETLGDAYSLLESLIPDRLYAVSTFTMDVDSTGKTVLTSKEFALNNTENAVTKALFKIIASEADSDDTKTEEEQKAVINDKIGDAFESIVYNLGFVGTVEAGAYDTTTGEITDMTKVTYSANGILDGKIIVITRKNVIL